MAIRLKFKHQKFQEDAAESVCRIFAGQDDSANEYDTAGNIPGVLTGYGNTEITLSDAQILANLQNVQSENGLNPSDELDKDGRVFTVEMETGTGKTYTYLKTIHELHRRYGWGKYIVVVPSIAIREGVRKTFDITEQHFKEDYDSPTSAFIYDSSDMGRIGSFVSNPGIDIMIINAQAFNASKAESRRITTPHESLSYRKPVDVIAEVRPIVIIDEPQSVEGGQTLKSLEDFRPLFTLRYSATPRFCYNLVYRLDAVDAYKQKLVKRICVTGISMCNVPAQGGYVYLKGIIKSDKDPVAVIEFDCRGANGGRRITRKVNEGTDLYEKSGGLDEYKAGYIVRGIDAFNMTVEFLNGIRISPGEIAGYTDEDMIRRKQIRETIEQHLRKERQLHSQGIKVLSLFFIDRVDNYRIYDDDRALPGVFARIFEEQYREAVSEFQHELDEGSYAGYLASIKPEETHAGYFSIDKKNHMTDSKPTSKKDDTSDDISAFDLIMRDKERLLSMGEPVRFIFSHSALREGWDNP
ncbi:MAG: DEAD/DEAH box helicase family protein, partial [Synergistaceae bacterium]|nr:DEAD/DEAH box helicase family protein [Synergistaceae bacterium]